VTTGRDFAAHARAVRVQSLADRVAPGTFKIYGYFTTKKDIVTRIHLTFDLPKVPARMREKQWGRDSFGSVVERMEALAESIQDEWGVGSASGVDSESGFATVVWTLSESNTGPIYDDATMVRFFRSIVREIDRFDLIDRVVPMGSV